MDELALIEPRLKMAPFTALSLLRGFTLIVNPSPLPHLPLPILPLHSASFLFFFFLTSVLRAVINFHWGERETAETPRKLLLASDKAIAFPVSLSSFTLRPALSADNKSLWNLINLTLGTV